MTLVNFLNDQALDLGDIYRGSANSGWTALRRAAGILHGQPSVDEEYIGRRYADLLHANDPACLDLWERIAKHGEQLWREIDPADQTRTQMLAYQLFARHEHRMDGEAFLHKLDQSPSLLGELGELAQLLAARSDLSLKAISVG